MSSGKEKAWDLLNGLEPARVSRDAGASYDEKTGSYILRSFSFDFLLNPSMRSMTCHSEEGLSFLNKYDFFFKGSALWYLISAKEIPLTGRLIKPVNLAGGQLFFRGTHVLPLDGLAERYGKDKDAFIKKGKSLGAKEENYGDASITLYPFPKIPVTLILWLSDDEYPARADMLFDSTCELRLPLDVIWSVAMLSILAMM
jgi:hypothetical protein